MTTITKLDTKTGTLIQKEMADALQGIAAKYGVSIKTHGGTIGLGGLDLVAKFRVEVTNPEAKADAQKREFEQYCMLFNLTPEQFGATFVNRGITYKISGLAMNKRKFPIRGTSTVDGKELLFTTDVVRLLAPTPIAAA